MMAVLIVGDADYIPVIQEVQRLGKIVCVSFFTGEESCLSEELRNVPDGFFDLQLEFKDSWQRFVNSQKS